MPSAHGSRHGWAPIRLRYCFTSANAGEVIDKSYWGGGDEILYTCAIEPLASDYPTFPPKKRTSERDILLTRNGTPYVHKPVANAIYSNVVQRLTLRPGLDRRFVAYSLQSAASQSLKGYGVSIESLNFEMWKEMVLHLPPISEQSHIADFLDLETAKADALVAKYERLIELLEEKRVALITQAVTKGLDPNAPMSDSGIEWVGSIPLGWSAVPLKYLCAIDNSGCYGGEPGEGDLDYPVATTAQINPLGRFNVEAMAVRSFSALEVERYRCVAGDILVVKSSGSASNIISGKSGLITPETPEFIFSNFLLRIRADQHRVIPEFLYRFLSCYVTRQRIERMCSTTTYPNLKVGDYSAALVPVPPPRIQGEIVAWINKQIGDIDSLLSGAAAAIALTKEHRLALITAAVTGQIDALRYKAKDPEEVVA